MTGLKNLARLVITTATLLLMSCATATQPNLQTQVDAMSPCEKIDGLVSAYTNDFEAIKGRMSSSRYMGIWEAKVDAVGRGCQIWLQGNKAATYVCTQVAPNEDAARDWFNDAVNTINQCLSDWQQEDLTKKDDDGQRTVWSKRGNFPTISTHIIPTKGAYSNHWTQYFFVGQRDDRF